MLAGFSQSDASAAASWMREMEPDFRVSHVTDEMMRDLLSTALYDPETQVCPRTAGSLWWSAQPSSYVWARRQNC